MWDGDIITSRLAEDEAFVRLRARGAPPGAFDTTRALLDRLDWLELSTEVLARALEPFPRGTAPRTLDALHLASADYLRRAGFAVQLATYDARMGAAALALGLELYPL